MGEYCAVLIQLNAKQAARKFFNYGSRDFDAIFFAHSPLVVEYAGLHRAQPPHSDNTANALCRHRWFTLDSEPVLGEEWRRLVTAPNKEFQNKNVLVTGGGRGIGKRLALGFARMGAKIALVGRSKPEIDLAHIEIEQAGGNALRIRADVTDPEQMAVAVDRARVAFGSPIDILVCAAATPGPLYPFLQTPLKAWSEALQINLLGVVHACRAVLPAMIERRAGKILVLVCGVDQVPVSNFSAYSTSKTAVVRFVEAIATEVLDDNVQVNCLDPGPAYTTLTDELIRAESRLEARIVEDAKQTRRTGGTSPDLQLQHAAFLASEGANHITGKLIHVSDDWKKLKNSTVRPDALTLRRQSK